MAVSDLKIPGETSIALDVNSSSFRLLCEVRGWLYPCSHQRRGWTKVCRDGNLSCKASPKSEALAKYSGWRPRWQPRSCWSCCICGCGKSRAQINRLSNTIAHMSEMIMLDSRGLLGTKDSQANWITEFCVLLSLSSVLCCYSRICSCNLRLLSELTLFIQMGSTLCLLSWLTGVGTFTYRMKWGLSQTGGVKVDMWEILPLRCTTFLLNLPGTCCEHCAGASETSLSC